MDTQKLKTKEHKHTTKENRLCLEEQKEEEKNKEELQKQLENK